MVKYVLVLGLVMAFFSTAFADTIQYTEKNTKTVTAVFRATRTSNAKKQATGGKGVHAVPLFEETLRGQVYLVFYEGYAKWQNVTMEELELKTLQDYDEVNRQIGRWCKKTRKDNNYAFGYWNGEQAKTKDGKGVKIGVVGIDMSAAKMVHYTVQQMYWVNVERHPEHIWLSSLEYMQKAKKLYHPDYVAVLPGSERGKRGKNKLQMHKGWLIKAEAAELVEY